jgi:hypothetical protein
MAVGVIGSVAVAVIDTVAVAVHVHGNDTVGVIGSALTIRGRSSS